MSALSLDYFGDKDWSDIRERITAKIKFRWQSRATPEDIEDAVSDAMLDLIDYWIELPSSIDVENPERNIKWATWRGHQAAQAFLLQRLDERRQIISLDAGGEEEDGEEYIPRHERLEDPSEGPEELAIDADELRLARDLLADLPDDELRTWLGDYLSGLGVREQATIEGIAPSSVSRRRQWGMKRLRRAAYAAGLL